MLKNIIIHKLQSFDPFKNIAFENWLLYNSPSDHVNIVLWRDNPCIVIGRNQNPWAECNIPLLHKLKIPIIRRYSGGGTVYHDPGCAIWSVIMPKNIFSRDLFCNKIANLLNDKYHLELIVNHRYDICTRHGLKVSGPAFKITREKAVHHGTLLIKGSSLNSIDIFLKSPFEVIGPRTSSTRSSVTSLPINYEEFEAAIFEHFNGASLTWIPSDYDNPEILKFEQELRSSNWLYSKLPHFKIPSLGLEVQDGIITSSPNNQYNGHLLDPECSVFTRTKTFEGIDSIVTNIDIDNDGAITRVKM